MKAMEFDLNALVRAGEESIRLLAGKGLEVTFELDPELAAARADPGAAMEALLKLVLIARDATRRNGSLRIETGNVRLQHDSAVMPPVREPGDFVALSVADTGTSWQAARRLFDPFVANNEASGDPELTPASAYSLIEECRGYVEVSESVLGTSFVLYLPRGNGCSAAH